MKSPTFNLSIENDFGLCFAKYYCQYFVLYGTPIIAVKEKGKVVLAVHVTKLPLSIVQDYM